MNRRPFKILLQGYFGYGNVGDEALCSVLINELKEKPDTEVIVSSLNPRRSRRLHNVKSCSRNYTFEFIKQLLTAHVLIFGGGGKYGWRTFRRICIMSLLVKLFGKKLIFRNVGLYYFPWSSVKVVPKPPKNLLKRALLILTFSLADKITVRDKISEHFLRLCGVKKRIDIEKDLALKLKPSTFENSCKLLSNYVNLNNKKLCIGVNFRTLEAETNNKFMKVIPKTLDWIIETFDAEIVFVPFGYGSIPQRFFDDDRIIAKEIKQHMKQKTRFKIIGKELRPEDILGIFGLFDLFIGVRYHSIVFSEVVNVPALALVYDTKVEYFLKQNTSKISSILLDELNEYKIKEVLQELLQSSALI